MANKIFEMSKNGKSEYCVDIVRVGELIPIEGSDFLAQTFIGDASIVVRKDLVSEGQLLFYVSNECQINKRFLSVNNLFEIGSRELNSNSADVEELLAKGAISRKRANSAVSDEDRNKYLNEEDKYKKQAKSKCGFFPHNGRVRMIRLRKTPSMGYLFGIDEMAKFCPKVKDVNLEDYLNVDFDTVDGELFVKAYVPPVKESSKRGDKSTKRNKKLNRFDRMIEGEFSFHYDTALLAKNMQLIKPSDVVDIDLKFHGTSGIFSNTLIKNPIKIAFYKRLWNKFVDKFNMFTSTRFIDYVIDYGNVYSSRTVIKNQYINKEVTDGYYNYDIWGEANEIIKPYLDKGMTVYAEICGYAGDKIIQKGYDYGCNLGDFFIMPYRITTKTNEEKYEWNVTEVKEWTEKLIKEHTELASKIHPITLLYHGTLKDLYPTVSETEHWHENVLHKMMNDKEHFGMEELEPLCKNKVPREGIVLRIANDPCSEAFKLKCVKFKEREAKAVDNGEVDVEMNEAYC